MKKRPISEDYSQGAAPGSADGKPFKIYNIVYLPQKNSNMFIENYFLKPNILIKDLYLGKSLLLKYLRNLFLFATSISKVLLQL